MEKEPAPQNSLPTWEECALLVGNSEYIAKRVAEGGYGPDHDSELATELHRFIYEYDDSDSYRSAWFLHRLELVLKERQAEIESLKAQLAECRDKALEEAALTVEARGMRIGGAIQPNKTAKEIRSLKGEKP